MQQIIAVVVALGVLLVVAWVILTALALGWLGSAGEAYFGSQWREMVLGFFGRDPEWVIAAWWTSTIVSTTGWLMGFAGVWVEMDRRLGANTTLGDEAVIRQCEYYMKMCASQLGVLLGWTAVVVLVQPANHLAWRLLCVAFLLAVTVIYAFTAYAFIEIRESWMPREYWIAASSFICVHAAHGFFWDCVYWGRSYIKYDAGKPMRETLAYMRVDMLGGYRAAPGGGVL